MKVVSGGKDKIAKRATGRGKSTFANQETLPRLPVPRLTLDEELPAGHEKAMNYEPTLARWTKAVSVMVKGEEMKELERVTADFAKPGGVGRRLSAALRERARAKGERALAEGRTSWMAEWWASWAYMGYRESVAINVSYHYIFDAYPTAATQLERAATTTFAWLKAMRMLQEERLPADEIRGVAQDMSSYLNMFGTCRIPAKPDDYLAHTKPEQCRHIIVACQNLFFTLPCFDPASGLPYSIPALQTALANIQQQAQRLAGSQPPIGILTAQHRDTWTDVRTSLLRSPLVAESLKVIEQAAFVLNLDHFNPTTQDNTCATLLHGGSYPHHASANRYFDKSFNVVVFPDGRTGLVGEHSGIDGYPTTVITDMVWEMTADPSKIAEISGNGDFADVKLVPEGRLLKFVEEGKTDTSIKQFCDEAIAYHNKNVAKVDMTLLRFNHYGTKEIKAAGVSPDGFVQMAFQLAYHRIHNDYAPVYESCSTRQYLHGRTEVGRSLSNDAVAFVESFDNPALSLVDKYSVFKKACESHIAYIRDASDGYGCDRHILGMKLIGKEEGVPEHPFFSLPAHSKTTHWKLSTSQLPSKHSITGFGPVVEDGYGIFYNLRANQLNFHISSFLSSPTPTSCHKLSKSLSDSLLEIQTMCKTALTQAKL